jgi:nicotinamide-nucleotide amidase
LLTDKNLTVSTAESCTGGSIASLFTSIPGSSAYFVGSIISYTRNLIEELLKVSSNSIDEFGIVSSQVAEAMALGVQRKLKTDYAIATTGNAGPTKDDADKTVGTVYIAIATPNGVFSEEFFFGKPRSKVIQRATNKSLEMLRKEIIKNS